MFKGLFLLAQQVEQMLLIVVIRNSVNTEVTPEEMVMDSRSQLLFQMENAHL